MTAAPRDRAARTAPGARVVTPAVLAVLAVLGLVAAARLAVTAAVADPTPPATQPPAAQPAPATPPRPSWLPRYWRALPDITRAIAAAIDTTPAGARPRRSAIEHQLGAWGDPAAGCFLIAGDLSVASIDATRFQDAWRERAAELAGGALEAWEQTGDQAASESRLVFQRGDIQGRARVMARVDDAGNLRVRAGVCFYTPRQPRQSAVQCQALLDRLEEIP